MPTYAAGRFSKSEVFELPWMTVSAKAGSQAFWDYVQKNSLDEFKGTHLIFLHLHDGAVLHTSGKVVKTLADLRGLKIRGATRINARMLVALGATPVQMPLPQVPDAMSKGVIDGAVIPWEVVPSVKVNELAKFHSEFDPKLPALYTTTFVMAMNKAKYDALPADLKKVIDANSGLETSAWLGKTQEGNDPRGRKTAEERNNTITRLTAADYEAFRKAADLVDDDWVKEMSGKGINGKQLLDAAKALIQKNTK